MDRSARVFSGDLLCCSILPPMCSRNVRSVVSMTATPSIAASAPTIVSQCSLPEASTVMSRSRTPSLTSTRSMDPIDAPTCPIALATRPSMPGRSAISTRIVRLYWADGEGDIWPLTLGEGQAPGAGPPAYLHASPRGPPLGSLSDGRQRVRRQPRRALPDRRQLARLPGVLRPAGVHRDLHGRADQRDLRLRVDAREAPDRARPEAHGR